MNRVIKFLTLTLILIVLQLSNIAQTSPKIERLTTEIVRNIKSDSRYGDVIFHEKSTWKDDVFVGEVEPTNELELQIKY